MTTAQDGTRPTHSDAAMRAPDPRAPGRLELVRSFVNTQDIEDGIEDLATPEAARDWLRDRGLPDVPRIDTRQLERLIELRGALRELMLANNGEAHDERALEHLRAEAARADLCVRFEASGESVLVPAGAGVDAVVADLIGIVHQAMTDGTWPRLKACRADDCQWAFYDRSRNRSGKWCSMEVCGNRAKARSYRRRHGRHAQEA